MASPLRQESRGEERSSEVVFNMLSYELRCCLFVSRLSQSFMEHFPWGARGRPPLRYPSLTRCPPSPPPDGGNCLKCHKGQASSSYDNSCRSQIWPHWLSPQGLAPNYGTQGLVNIPPPYNRAESYNGHGPNSGPPSPPSRQERPNSEPPLPFSICLSFS